jgi:anaerobic selenocysteine-containing dehydrogenase
VVSSSRGVLEPCSPHLKSETAIICELANKIFSQQATGDSRQTSVNWLELKTDYDKIRDLIEKVIKGFDDFNKKVRQPAGFYLPNGAREQKFNTKSGKAHFTINETSKIQLKQGEYVMMTIRSHDQYNTTIYGLDDRYRGVFNERRVIFMNEKDMNTACPDESGKGLKVYDVVDLYSEYQGVVRKAEHFIVVPYDIPQGNVATYFPEANTLIPVNEYADKSFTPISKSVVVRIERVTPLNK